MKKITALAVSLFLLTNISAQKLSGKISQLKGQEEVNVVIDFSNIKVNGKTEAKFLEDETAKKTEEERIKWYQEWNEDMKSSAHSLFIREFNKHSTENTFSVGDFENTEYTIIVKIVEINTGFFGGPFARPSLINADVKFVKTGETEAFATIKCPKSSSALSSTVPYFVTRIAMSVGKVGEIAAKTVGKDLK